MEAENGGRAPGGAAAAWVLALIAGGGAAFFVQRVPAVSAGATPAAVWDWAPALGVSLAFRLDGLSLLFALLITVFGALIAVYAGRYLAGHRHLTRFVVYLGLFMAGMLGLVLADDLILLFVFWEVTTVASFLLIGFSHDQAKARRNAWQALLVTGAGGLCLLAGLVLLGTAAGTTRLSEIAAAGPLGEHALYLPILALVLLGAFTKSAQVPFHFWLPNAMAAPTPVSAYLHSATMVKAGIYLLSRLHPVLAGTEAWTLTLSAVGGTTMVLAAILAVRQTDLKLALAQTSVMALGALVMFLGAEKTIAIAAAMTFLLVHALYKAALFLIVGAIEKGTGTREIAVLGGLWRRMPATSTAAVLAAGSMAGFPPFLGFIGKELKYEGALAIAEEPLALASAAVLANALMVTLALVVGLKVVFGRPGPLPKTPREVSPLLWGPPLVLAILGLICGVAPDLVGRTLVQPAVTAVAGQPEVVQLKLWHGVNLPLLLSFATVAIGLAAYLLRPRLARLLASVPSLSDRAWDGVMAGIAAGFKALARAMQPGSLRFYLGVTFAVLAFLPLGGLALAGTWPRLTVAALAEPAALGAAALAAAGALMTATAHRRMTAIGGLGAVGTGIAMLFTLYGAPDVAITQLLVDILLIVLIAAAMHRLPDLGPRRRGRARDAAVAGATGLAFGLLTLAVVDAPFTSPAAETMAAISVPEAKGRNIVNVVLVDFRALDTFGEIVVVAAAAIGAVALIAYARSTAGRRL